MVSIVAVVISCPELWAPHRRAVLNGTQQVLCHVRDWMESAVNARIFRIAPAILYVGIVVFVGIRTTLVGMQLRRLCIPRRWSAEMLHGRDG